MSSGSTRRPLTPSTTSSAPAPERVVIDRLPSARHSSVERPKASFSEGMTQTSAEHEGEGVGLLAEESDARGRRYHPSTRTECDIGAAVQHLAHEDHARSRALRIPERLDDPPLPLAARNAAEHYHPQHIGRGIGEELGQILAQVIHREV